MSWFNKLSVISLVALQGHAWGWGTQYTLPNLEAPEVPSSIHFPLNENQAWFVKPSYLIWRPHQDGASLGYKITYESLDSFNFNQSTKMLDLDFEWGSGFRLGVGRYLPNHDQWDVTFFMTYMYNDSESTFNANVGDVDHTVAGDSFNDIGWSDFFLSPDLIPKSRVNWRLNYFTWDLSIGRHFTLTRTLEVHPYIGLRAALIDQTYFNRNVDLFVDSNNTITPLSTRFKAENNFWGIGSRLGTEFSFRFGHGWSFLGNFSGSFLLSHYNIKERLNGLFDGIPYNINVKDGDTVLRANVEGALGLGWEKWVRNHSVRIAPSFLFEATEWFAVNQWVGNLNADFRGSPNFLVNTDRRKQKDLGLLGFSVNLQIDF